MLSPGFNVGMALVAEEIVEQAHNQESPIVGNRIADQPALALCLDHALAALTTDLKSKGLLDKTLIVVATEFGRPAEFDGRGGRGHQGSAFSMVLAGGGLRHRGAYGVTDDLSKKVVEKPVSVPDFHATILHLLGLDHERLTYRYQGRDFRLTDVHGHIVRDILA